ncbi:exo-rhamnogalacturonan lyase family protein [Streptomyces odontomachi]|uniref:exo-rhamnogalacturonan lyase family protein n=1 Tax=Streptomyces odontomachi TaxID=2944940 RepID=UPI00210DF7EC|nr:hypothetical protein [Streptomyces sp. ODS25]
MARQPAGQPSSAAPEGEREQVPLHWLGSPPQAPSGTRWGVPWPRGTVPADGAGFALSTVDGRAVPVQSWPLAYWPDGSLKWTGHAVGPHEAAEGYVLAAGSEPAPPAHPVTVAETADTLTLTNGLVDVRLARSGPVAIRSVTRGGRTTARDGRLVLHLQDGPDEAPGTLHRTAWTGIVEDATVEQHGPVRAVVKLSGRHRQDGNETDEAADARTLLPWTLRVELSADGDEVRLVHHFVWDGDADADFVRGLGLEVAVPLAGATHDRHVRFGSCSGGVWGEPVRVLTGLRQDPGAAVRAAQVAGEPAPPVEQWTDAATRTGHRDLAEWNDFTLFQESPRHYAVWKRTSASGVWLKHAGRGERAAGFGYVGGDGGGLGFGMTDFWQRFPRSLDIRAAASDTATVTLWSWSPHGGAMDLRSYDGVPHGLDLAYEDTQEGFGTAEGMTRSTEFRLWALRGTPARADVARLSSLLTAPPHLVAEPAHYHHTRVFGRWSLPDRSTPGRAAREDALAADVAYYATEVEQREWYGFWHHGDVMHSYDTDRHEWRYDVGGYAWDNAELGTDALLWYAFLRSGDPATFRLAQAMTQHVSEADTYLTGRFAGLGSRHNVVHWGCGAKEARIAESFTRRFGYYLTADELLGDLIRNSLKADETLRRIDPLRMILPPQSEAPVRLRIGPDWYALVSNWMAEWERTGDTHYRDLITTGMTDLADAGAFPAGLFTGQHNGAIGFDPATGHLTNIGAGRDDFAGGYHLATAFLGEQIIWEALDLLDPLGASESDTPGASAFRTVWLDFCRYGLATPEERTARYGFDFDASLRPSFHSRLTAWAGEQLDDPELRRRGWDQLLSDPRARVWPAPRRIEGDAVAEPVDEVPDPDGVFTNQMAQRDLAWIALLDIAPAEAP